MAKKRKQPVHHGWVWRTLVALPEGALWPGSEPTLAGTLIPSRFRAGLKEPEHNSFLFGGWAGEWVRVKLVEVKL
jgi:hypothetical protein